MMQRFGGFALAVLLAVGASAPAALAAEAIVGTFMGKVSTGGAEADVTTVIAQRGDTLAGTYSVTGDPSGDFTGTLDQGRLETGRRYAFAWHDPYGEGRVVFAFAADFRSFTGKWYAPDGRPGGTWSGAR
jgi:hypothetical protein